MSQLKPKEDTMFKMSIDKAGSHASTYTPGMYFYTRNDTIHAVWTFEDGVEVHLDERRDTTTYHRGRPSFTRRTELTKAPRVYVDARETFDVVEDLTNRTRRPWQAWKPQVREALERIGISTRKLSWSQHAGCSCPCSPGFVIDNLGSFDIWVKLPGAPTVDETKPGRTFAA